MSRTYTKPGTYTGKVTATDDEGDKTVKEVTVTVTAPGVQPPTVDASANVTSGPARLTVAFNATGTDPDGPASQLTYKWEFGDGVTSFLQNPTHTYGTKGTYTAKVTVDDGSGATATKTITITVTDPAGNQAPTIENADPLPPGDRWQYQFTAWATDPEDEAITYEWDFDDGSAKGDRHRRRPTRSRQRRHLQRQADVKDPHGATATKTIAVDRHRDRQPGADGRRRRADPLSGTAPLRCSSARSAKDPEGGQLSYVWTFGDGGFSAEPAPRCTRSRRPGTYTVDADGRPTRRALSTTDDGHDHRDRRAGRAGPGGADKARTRAPAVDAVVRRRQDRQDHRRRVHQERPGGPGHRTEAMTGTATLTVSKAGRQAAGSEEDHAGVRQGEVHLRRHASR